MNENETTVKRVKTAASRSADQEGCLVIRQEFGHQKISSDCISVKSTRRFLQLDDTQPYPMA